jgi:pSer/pThr/pTyr-binding forkhead associated (FHA) protein
MQNYGKLVLILADGAEQAFPLTAAQISLGREAGNDIVLADEKVSRQHARLEADEQGYVLVDLGSANGVFVENRRVDRARLVSGNLIRLGNSTLRYEAAPPPAPAAVRPRPRPTGETKELFDQLLQSLEDDVSEAERSSTVTTLRHRLRQVARLVIHTPDRGWQELPLTDQEYWTIGRDPGSDIFIDHPKVSRRHARIERQGHRFVIRDLGSTNGTWLGQQKIETHSLGHTETLNIGHARLIFKEAGPDELAADRSGQEAGQTPVIVVPGSFGSSLWQGSEQIWPSVRNLLTAPEKLALPDEAPVEARSVVGEVVVVPKLFQIESYSRIGNYLESDLNYTRGKDLLEFAYDWRLDFRLAARRLAQVVEAWPVTPPITIIAHSMGCLVSRYYVDCLGGHKTVGRLVLMGGPNYGLAGGLVNFLPAHLSHELPATVSLGGALGRKIVDMFSTFPANCQILPTYPCIFDQNGQPIDLYQDETWLPPEKRPLLQAAREFHRQLNPRATVPTVCIFGYGTRTTTRVNIKRDPRGQWQAVEFIGEADGDGMVETRSAILDGAEIHPVQQGHNSLYIDEDVLMRLKLELTR